jgi:hypothetical protein
MATRHGGRYQFGSSSYNPLTGESIQTPGLVVDRASVNYFVKQQPGAARQEAYQPPIKPVRTLWDDKLTKPINEHVGTVWKSLEERDRAMAKPISQEHVLTRRPQTASDSARVNIVHLQTPPPWATDDVVLTTRSHFSPRTGGSSRFRSKSAHSNHRDAAGMPSGVSHLYRNTTSTSNVVYADDETVLLPTSPHGQQEFKRTVQSYLSSVKLQEQQQGGNDDDDYQLPTQASSSSQPGYMRHTRSSSQAGSRTGSRAVSRGASPERAAREFGHASQSKAILFDIQKPPPQHPLDQYRSGTPKESLPAAGQRSSSSGPVVLDHPLDFVSPDIGMPKQYRKTVRERINQQNNPSLLELAIGSGQVTPRQQQQQQQQQQNYSQSGSQTPQYSQQQQFYDDQPQEQSQQQPYQSHSGFVSGSSTPHSQRPGAWVQSPSAAVAVQPSYVESPSVGYSVPQPSTTNAGQQQLDNDVDALAPRSRGDSEAPSRSGAGYSNNSAAQYLSPTRSTSSVHQPRPANGMGATPGGQQSGSATPRQQQQQQQQQQQPQSGSATPRSQKQPQQLTSPPQQQQPISPRVLAWQQQRPAGIGGVNAKQPKEVFALNFAFADAPQQQQAASSVPASGVATPQRQGGQQQQQAQISSPPQAQSSSRTPQQPHTLQQQQQSQASQPQSASRQQPASAQQGQTPSPSQPPQQSHNQAASSSHTPRQSFTPSRSSAGPVVQSARQAQVNALQAQLAALQTELRNIHSEASSGLTTPHSGAQTPFVTNLRVQPGNAGIFNAIVEANANSHTQQPPSKDHPLVIVHPQIGNSSTGFRPHSASHTPKLNGPTKQPDPTITTHRPAAGKASAVAPQKVTDSNEYSIAHPPPAPTRLQPGIQSGSIFEGASLQRPVPASPKGKRRVEIKKFQHPDEETPVEIITAPPVYRDANTATNALPMGGPLLYDRYEPRPTEQRRLRAPGSRENVTSQYYQESSILSSPVVKVVPKKPQPPKLWKV